MKQTLLFYFSSLVFITNLAIGQETIYADEKYGFDANSAQENFYNAINGEKGTGNTLIFRDMGSPWYLVDEKRIFDLDDLTIIFEPGCIIEAKKESWFAGEILINVLRSSNATIIGYGATFKMYKSDFNAGPNGETDGSTLESGHCFNIVKANNLTIKGLTIDGSGGDAFRVDQWSNSVLEDIDAVNHKRQGISIISCNQITVRHCRFRNTSGAAPTAGVDIEPNTNMDDIIGCKFSNCSFSNNEYAGIAVALTFTNNEAKPISIEFENCYLSNNNLKPPYQPSALIMSTSGYQRVSQNGEIVLEGDPSLAVNGSVTLKDIAIDGDRYNFLTSRKSYQGYKVDMNNVAAVNLYQSPMPQDTVNRALIQFETPNYDFTNGNGGIDFGNTLLHTTKELAPLRIIGNYRSNPGTYQGLRDLKGTVTMVRPTDKPSVFINYNGSEDQNMTLNLDQNMELPETVVSIQAIDPIATKTGVPGILEITRSSSRIDYPLFVKYKYESTEVKQGDDIHYLTGAVVIGANETKAQVVIEARDNGRTETDKNIVLTIEERPLYTIGSQRAANIVVSDDESTLSTDDFNSNRIRMYPVPSKDYLTIEGLDTNKNIRIYNSLGQLVSENTGDTKLVFSIKQFPKGLYFVNIDGAKKTFRFVKQ